MLWVRAVLQKVETVLICHKWKGPAALHLLKMPRIYCAEGLHFLYMQHDLLIHPLLEGCYALWGEPHRLQGNLESGGGVKVHKNVACPPGHFFSFSIM